MLVPKGFKYPFKCLCESQPYRVGASSVLLRLESGCRRSCRGSKRDQQYAPGRWLASQEERDVTTSLRRNEEEAVCRGCIRGRIKMRHPG